MKTLKIGPFLIFLILGLTAHWSDCMGQNEKPKAKNNSALGIKQFHPKPATALQPLSLDGVVIIQAGNYDTNIPDSLQFHKVRKWILWRMIAEVERGRSCDSLQRYQADLIQKDTQLINRQDSLLELRKKEILALNQSLSVTNDLYVNEIAKERLQKKQVRKWKTISIVSAGVLIAHFIFHQ